MLTQLKNGNWIDLAYVQVVRLTSSASIDLQVRYSVYVASGNSGDTIHFETKDEAEAYRDELAALVNEAQAAATCQVSVTAPAPNG